ncbi:hypothetical protein [Lacticaseibacillus nasuensis]|uniref:hypothetical protein n=1 Tax=Lacticaseibacillus nasuensis TaxID=944671 RepID=UPI0022480282|nr:hypothetical protein [Lacticaseibacillus nasuensis]MCX2455071.1 hypothetical protein [Lacticaseibacillus nasuensis]
MTAITDEQRNEALKIYATTIKNCQKMQPKFAPGTPQASLLTNRINALQVVEGIVRNSGEYFTREQLTTSVAPIKSIIHKTSVARSKYALDTPVYKRLTPMINATEIGLAALEQRLNQEA